MTQPWGGGRQHQGRGGGWLRWSSVEATPTTHAALYKQHDGERSNDGGAGSLDEADDLVNRLPKTSTATRAVAPDRLGVDGHVARP